MKIKKNQIITIIEIAILFISIVISGIINKPLFFICGIIVIFMETTIGSAIESRKIFRRINDCFATKDYEDVIEFLKNKVDKNYFIYTNDICLTYLVLFYMYNDEALKAKEIMVNNSKLNNAKELFYSRYIIAIAENNKKDADIYFDKVINLKNKQFNVQKETIVKIKKMIESNVCDNEVLENTKIPLLKNICRKINGEDITIESLDVNKVIFEKTEIIKSKGIFKLFKIILNILTCLTLYIGMFIIAVSITKYEIITSFEGLYRALQMIWIMFLLLPISLGNVAYGIFLKTKNYCYKSNVIIGIVFSILLFMIGSMSFLSSGQFKEDKDYLYNLEASIKVDFPDEFVIITDDWTRGTQSSSDNTLLKYESIVKFNDNVSLSFDTKWTDELSSKDMLPTLFVLQTVDYEKYLIYCFDTAEYNPQSINKDYDYVAIAYDVENNNLLIYEFYLK